MLFSGRFVMPKLLIAGNWKMNTTIAEAEALAREMRPGLEAVEGIDRVVCPPFVSLSAVRDVLEGSGVAVGAQNMYHEGSGAYTGEVSPTMLAGLCEFVILGHSERRHVLGESDEMVGNKVAAAVEAGLRPILCVGETLDERDVGHAGSVVERQLTAGLAQVDKPGRLVVAYEPVWAIGTGKAATPADAEAMMSGVREHLTIRYGAQAAVGVLLLYGGSVTADNVADFVGEQSIDGALVGGASLNAEFFVNLVRNSAAASRQRT